MADPVYAAASMQNKRSSAMLGTLACFAVRRSNPSRQVLLGNNHVIYEGGRKEGESLAICSPDSGSCCCTKHIVAHATDLGFEAVPPGSQAWVDCAIAELDPAKKVGINQIGSLAKGAEAPAGGPNPGIYIAGWADAVNNEAVRVATYRRVIRGTVTTGYDEHGKAGQLFIKVAPGEEETVVLGSGDSGAGVFNRFNQIVGLMWARGASNPNAINENSDTIFACPIRPVLDALGIDIPSAVPADAHAGLALLPVPPPPAAMPRSAPPDELEGVDLARLRAAEQRLRATPLGDELVEAGYRHSAEVAELVHHHRRVTLAWHRSRGPAWSAHLMNAAREDGYEVPLEVDGITRAQLLECMRDQLLAHGSKDLRADVERYAAMLIGGAAYGSVSEVFERVENGSLGAPA